MENIRPGLVGEAHMMVGTNDTAPRVGSGRIAVLATPVMINLIEAAALGAVEHLLPEGMQSLGTHLDVTHIAATPIGMEVTAEARLKEVNGRKLTFEVVARDDVEVIGSGMHERVVVRADKFRARIDEKSARAKSR